MNQKHSLNILLIEDNVVDAQLVELTLKESQLFDIHLTVHSRTGDAVEILKTKTFDVIISDLNLKDTSGLKTLDLLKPYSKDIPLIVLTGDDDEEIAKDILASGAQDYLAKRFINCHFMTRAINNAIERFKLLYSLYDSQIRFKKLAESAPNAIFMSTIEGTCTYTNHKFDELAGIKDSEVNWLDIIDERDRDRIHSLKEDSLKSGKAFESECRCGETDGQSRWMVLKAAPFRDEHGSSTGFIGNITDITVLKQAFLELEQRREKLEQSNLELDSFVYTASHDLRAPLRGVASNAQFLLEDYGDKLDEQAREYVDEIQIGINRMTRLIDDLLSLSRISRIESPFEVVSVESIIEEAVGRIEYDIQETGTVIEVDPDLPDMLCDRIKMTEVFLNLLNNAIKFSSKIENQKPVIRIRYKKMNDAHQFKIIDNGIGIESKFHDKVFGLFERLHDQSEYDGTGAGLSIVQRVINDHGGQIHIESEAGKGAAFIFSIPFKPVKRKRLGEILVEKGFITESQLRESLKSQDEIK